MFTSETAVTQLLQFPAFEEKLKTLVEDHKDLEEPLLLALYYLPASEAQDDNQPVHLIEICEGLIANDVSEEQDLFEISYGSTPDFPLKDDQWLQVVLANPVELALALKEKWTLAQALQSAVQSGSYRVLYESEAGPKLLELIRGEIEQK